MSECPALHWRWDLHVCGDLINKHSFVEIYHMFLKLRKYLRGHAVQHRNTHFVNVNTSFFMYVQFAFLHILWERTKMQSTTGMIEPEVGSTKYLGGHLLGLRQEVCL